MIDIQLDTLDIQVRDSLGYMLTSVNNGRDEALKMIFSNDAKKIEETKKKIAKVIEIFSNWNHTFELEDNGGSIYLAWEYHLASYFQETKIDNIGVRRCISSNILIENFVYKEYRDWSYEEAPYR